MKNFPTRVLKIAFLVLLVVGQARADMTTASGKIDRLHFWQGIPGALVLHSDRRDVDSCGTVQYLLPSTHPNYKEIYAMLLAAYTSGKKVSLIMTGCQDGFPAIRHIYMNE